MTDRNQAGRRPHRIPALRRWTLLPALLGVAALALPSGCAKEKDAEEPGLSGARRREPTKVLVAEVARREMVRRLETTSRIRSERQVVVHPRTSGVVVELMVEEGDMVAEGDVMARLDDRQVRFAREDARAALGEATEAVPRLALAVKEWESRLATARHSADQAERSHQRNLAISQGEEGKPRLLSANELEESALALETARGELETAQLSKEKALLEHTAGERAVERAKLALERAELELSYMVITAPQAGVVSQRQVNVGDMLSPGAFDTAVSRAAFAITDPDLLEALLWRPQRELQLFRNAAVPPRDGGPDGDGHLPGNGHVPGSGRLKGLELTARAEGLPGIVFDGWIQRVSPVVDANSGNFCVYARLNPGQEPNRLLAGMLVRLEIVTERHPDALVVPKKAIVREGDQNLIYVVRDGLARKLEVEEGFTDGDDVEIILTGTGELAEGELVVVVGKDLEDGDEVLWPESTDVEPGPLESLDALAEEDPAAPTPPSDG